MLTTAELFDAARAEARTLGVADLEMMVVRQCAALTRFANSAIHQNVAEESVNVSVRPQIGQRTARATTNRRDPAAIRAVVREAITLTRAQDDNPHLIEMASPELVIAVDRWDQSTADCTPAKRAEAVAQAIEVARAAGQTAAGIYATSEWEEELLNTRGVACAHRQTGATLSITTMGTDSSGWAKQSSVRLADLDPLSLARQAVSKATLSRAPQELPPGAYTVILEPAAVLDLVGQMFGDFAGTAVEDQRSFLCQRMGEQLFGSKIHISDDVFHPLQCGAPFDGEGVARRRLTLVEAGVPKQLAYSRAAARRAGTAATGHGLALPNEAGECPVNIVVAGGDIPLEEMIRETPRGILVTRLWYIREVDPYEKIMTGMTRDGTFLIEDGQVARGVRNFRFNQGLIELLNNVEALSAPIRASGEECFDMVVPAMKANNFHFTEVTRF